MSNMLLNKLRLSILEEFTADYNCKIYGRNIAKKLCMNQKSVANTLKNLETANILKASTEGKNKYYSINKFNVSSKDVLGLAEMDKKLDFVSKNVAIKPLFYELEKRTNGILIIFGSYAKGANTKDSDLDLFVIGNIINIMDLEELYGIKINTVRVKKEKFNINDHLIKEVIKSHIILKGVEEFIGLIW